MSLLELLIANFGRTATIGSELYVTTTSVQDEYGHVNDTGITTIATSVTSALDEIKLPSYQIQMKEATEYVQSLSDEELARFDQMLDGENIVIELDEKNSVEVEQPKVYKR